MQWMRDRIRAEEASGMAISAISCWEIARLVSLKRLILNRPIDAWIADALAYPGIDLAPLTPRSASRRIPCRVNSIKTLLTGSLSRPPEC
jgi:PIN domain nuclease of toxin-antitoxin system